MISGPPDRSIRREITLGPPLPFSAALRQTGRMKGIFQLFGRSQEQQRLDDAFRKAGLHPNLVPEAVKIAAMKQVKDEKGQKPDDRDMFRAASMIAFCALGPDEFEEADAAALDLRIEAAIKEGGSLDARLILLCLHAGMLDPGLRQKYDIAAE